MGVYLRLDNLSKVFPGRRGHTAVDSLSLDVNEGEFLTILGPSGCGKTTVLRMIAGFEYPTKGRVHLGGIDITNRPPNKRDIAMVFQHYALFPHLSVFDNIAFGLLVRRIPRDEVKKRVFGILSRTGLTGLGQRMTNELSGGQQQRVALARALVVEPKVLLCDEPLSNLDASLRVQMRREVKRIQREFGITTVYVTHDHEEAMAISDRIALMNEGRLEQVGRPSDFYRTPKTSFVREFFGHAEILSGRIDNGRFSLTEARIRLPEGAVRPDSSTASIVLKPDELTVIED